MPDDPNNAETPRWLDDFANVKKVYRAVWVAALLLLVGGEAALIYARSADHGVHHGFAFESWPGFFSLYGFVACVALVLAAKELRKLLMRDEHYYDDEGRDGH